MYTIYIFNAIGFDTLIMKPTPHMQSLSKHDKQSQDVEHFQSAGWGNLTWQPHGFACDGKAGCMGSRMFPWSPRGQLSRERSCYQSIHYDAIMYMLGFALFLYFIGQRSPATHLGSHSLKKSHRHF